ncbi:tRNA uridine-5-carboxymethylaminomethyl(34) synthesis GTPase MnmE [Desulfurivibrio sp. D14AmB]|uniref:tRNA uridine-5-carboxymethylaminomethyl(34) synthesis GTPase MnmE n=1 Tax=Desulfurivibrio sp. D14AmB TaxID=3374370 RepID=UPI00376F2385
MDAYAEFEQATIAAIATPPGPGGIGIIRVSGPAAPAVLTRLFRPAKPAAHPAPIPSHRLRYGWIIDPGSGHPLDEVMAVYMAAPATYTREEVVEIHCHGGYVVLREILALILAMEGVRAAEPGEFTKRAFLNGRIDLTRAEAVLDLLNAETRQGLNLAISQLSGGLQQQLAGVRDALLAILAVLEVAIDFPDEDGEIIDHRQLHRQLAEGVNAPLAALLAGRARGRIFREGAAVVILGRPNVGKSSLLNALLREERAIVTAIPGTTRDTIEEGLNIHGVPVRIVDTAGIRESSEQVEEIGIRRSRSLGERADLVLLLLDAAAGVTAEDLALYESVREKNLLLVVNKVDLPEVAGGLAAQGTTPWAGDFPERPLVAISARTGQGLAALEDAVFQALTGGKPLDPGYACVPNARHEAALVKALEGAERVAAGLQNSLAPELMAVEVQGVLGQLGEISGETSGDDVLDAIFSRFCIGK